MKTKKLLTLLVMLLASLVLIACNNNNGDDKDPVNNGERIDFGDQITKKSVIRVWMDDEAGDYMGEIIDEFNKVHPNIIVEHQHKGTVDTREHLKTFGPSGNGADVLMFPHDHLSQAVLEDLLLALPQTTKDLVNSRSHELGRDIATMIYNEATGEFGSNSGGTEQLFAMPIQVESVGLYYNKTILASLDEEVPTTYEDLLRIVNKWNALPSAADAGRTNLEAGLAGLGNSSSWHDSYFVQHIFSAFGFTPFGPQLNNPASVGFESQAMQDALAWMYGTLRPTATGGGATDAVSGGGNFENNQTPFVIAGPWNNEAYTKAGVNYGVAQLPSIKVNNVDVATKSFAGAMMVGVYKYSKNQSDAIKFIEFLNSDVAMEIQYRLKAKLPALKTELLANIAGVQQDEKMMAMSAQLESSVPMPTIPQVTYYWGPAEAMLKAVWNEGVAIAAATKEAEDSYVTTSGLGS